MVLLKKIAAVFLLLLFLLTTVITVFHHHQGHNFGSEHKHHSEISAKCSVCDYLSARQVEYFSSYHPDLYFPQEIQFAEFLLKDSREIKDGILLQQTNRGPPIG